MKFVLFICLCLVSESLGSDDHPAHNPDKVPNFYPDSAPFELGVASGDPLPDSVIIWTRATPRSAQEIATGTEVHWRVWSPPDSTEDFPELQGNSTGTEATDWTVKLDASPLSFTNRTYFYRFYYGFRGEGANTGGETSRLGRTRTAPAENVTDGLLTIAHTTCTEQGYHLNAFAHLAWNMTLGGMVEPSLRPNRNSTAEPNENLLLQSESIHAVFHGGDSFYDFNRGPRSIQQWGTDGPFVAGLSDAYAPLPLEDVYDGSWNSFSFCYSFACFPTNRDNWRWWHITSRLDPDRRAAMAAHPHIMTPDSHDGGPQGSTDSSIESLQIFDLYYPVRTTYSIHPISNVTQIEFYRDFKFGELAHVIVVDMRGVGQRSPEQTFWGVPQRDFLRSVFQNGTKGFKVWNNGKPIVTNQITNWRRAIIGMNVLFQVIILLSLACCVVSFRKKRMLKGQSVSPSDSITVEGVKNPSFEAEKKDDVDIVESNAVTRNRIEATLQKIDCCPIAGSSPESLGPKKRCCINCCGSIFCIVLGVVLFFIPFVAMAKMIDVLGSQERLMYHPSTDSETLFGEIINLVGNSVDRAELFKDMYDNGEASDNIFLTGDSHMFWAADVNINSRGHYVLPDQAKGLIAEGRNVFSDSREQLSEKEAKIGVEVMPSSTSSHGIYDFLLDVLTPWQAAFGADVATFVFKHFNPHFVDVEVFSHGIGYVHITNSKARFEYYRACVFRAFQQSVLYWTGSIKRGANEWDKDDLQRYPHNWQIVANYP